MNPNKKQWCLCHSQQARIWARNGQRWGEGGAEGHRLWVKWVYEAWGPRQNVDAKGRRRPLAWRTADQDTRAWGEELLEEERSTSFTKAQRKKVVQAMNTGALEAEGWRRPQKYKGRQGGDTAATTTTSLKVSEAYSPPRVALQAIRVGLEQGTSFDILRLRDRMEFGRSQGCGRTQG